MSGETPAPTRTELSLSLDAVRGEVSKFDQIKAGLADLERRHPKDVVYDVTAGDGMESAIVARRAWRDPRIAVEKARKAAKAPVLELGRTIDKFAGDLEVELRAGEDHYDAQIKAEEQRKEAVRQERLQAEAEKIAAIRRKIVAVFQVGPNPTGARFTSAQLREIRERIEAVPIDDAYGDLKIEAQETKVQTLDELDRVIGEQALFEAQAAEIAQEKAALAEQKRLAAAEQKAQAEENARQQAQIDAQRAELARAEAEAADRERARQHAEQDAARVVREKELDQERAARAVAERIEAERMAGLTRLHQNALVMLTLLRDWAALDRNPVAQTQELWTLLRQTRTAVLEELEGVAA